MNLILLSAEDFIAPDRVLLQGRRKQHVLDVHRALPGDRLRVGLLDGRIGHGTILRLSEQELNMEIRLDSPPPEPLPVTLLLALPRPKMLRRVLQTCSAMGVKDLYLINSYRVDKSYWKSPLLQPEKLREQLLLGLEQAGDTLVPSVHLRSRFKPFVEDELPVLCGETAAYVAHPDRADSCPAVLTGPATLAIGPEGGFIPYEIARFEECGFQRISLGPRILRVETAVPVLLSRINTATEETVHGKP